MSVAPFPVVDAPFNSTLRSESTSPRAMIYIDNKPYTPISYNLEFNGHGATDTGTAILPIHGNPDWSLQIARNDELKNANQPVYFEVRAGFDGQPLQRRFYGVVDSWEAHFEEDLVTFTCRSLAAPLIDTKITTPFATATTTAQFLESQATRFGLGLVVNIAGSPGQMKDVLASEFIAGARNWIVWDLMLQCAQFDDVDLWVDKNGVIHYEDPSLIMRKTIPLAYGTDEIVRLSGSHAAQFSRNIEVNVRSYTKKTRLSHSTRVSTAPGGGIIQQSSSRTVGSSPVFGTNETLTTTTSPNGTVTTTISTTTGGPASSGVTRFASESGKQVYTIPVSGKTPQQCDVMAQQAWRQISMHENAVEFDVPVTSRLLPYVDITNLIRLNSMPYSSLNGDYWPRKITETFDSTRGWIWNFTALNHTLSKGAV